MEPTSSSALFGCLDFLIQPSTMWSKDLSRDHLCQAPPGPRGSIQTALGPLQIHCALNPRKLPQRSSAGHGVTCGQQWTGLLFTCFPADRGS